MSDVFMEYLVQKKKDNRDKLMIALIVLGAVIITLGLFMLMLMLSVAGTQNESMRAVGSMSFSIGFLLVAFVWYGAYLLINMRNIEYEYILTNNELDIDKVMSKKGRKHLLTIDISTIGRMARIDDEECNEAYKNPPEGTVVKNYSAMNKNGYTYFMDCSIDDKRHIVLIQPTHKMVEAMWRFNPRAVKRYSE